jgi:hypothetical protein
MTLPSNAVSVAADLVARYGRQAPEMALGAARQLAQRDDVKACAAWLHIYVATIRLLEPDGTTTIH